MPDGDGPNLRLTYAQLAEARGISKASAERLVRSRKWPRVLGNDGVAIVIVPPGETSPGSSPGSGGGNQGRRIRPGRPPRNPPPDQGAEPPPDFRGTIRDVVAPLREQLDIANRRADRAEQRADEERFRADRIEQETAKLHGEVTEAQAAERKAIELVKYVTAEASEQRRRADAATDAERIARDEAAGLRTELDARRQWGLARRLRWALGRGR
jgi:hypothetical protein